MVQTAPQPLTFDDFLALYPEDGGRYELRYGSIVEMRPIGPHEKVIGLIRRKLDYEIERLGLPYFIPQSCLIKPLRDKEGYLPDIIVLDETKVEADPYWAKHSSISTGEPVMLIVEVVSTNWQDDYLTKLGEYERLGVPEYWIADYRGLGGVRLIGSPKRPVIWTYQLAGEEYQAGTPHRAGQALKSAAFPELSLAVDSIIAAGAAP